MNSLTVLTTGVKSGIGKFIHASLGGKGLTREGSKTCIAQARSEGVDVLVHCAFNSAKDVSSQLLYDYHSDNVLLTLDLLTIPHRKFIYFSTVDVYPKNESIHTEEDIIQVDEVSGSYGITKLISESLVQRKSKNYLILRPTALLGQNMRKNTLIRLIEGETSALFLSGDSRFNYVLYSDVLDFINFAVQNDLTGIYNLASSTHVKLSEVTSFLNRDVTFGDYIYDVGKISNHKVVRVFPSFNKPSIETLEQFLEVQHEKA